MIKIKKNVISQVLAVFMAHWQIIFQGTLIVKK